MKLSRYFANLISSYSAELDDLRTDSEGNNVLKARLTKKREQLSQLLMMIEFSPEMVAVAFHGAFHFNDHKTMESLVGREASKFPAWADLQNGLTVEPWAQNLIKIVLTDPNGEKFLITTAGLEFLTKRHQIQAAAAPVQIERNDDEEQHEEHDNDDNDANLNSDERLDGDEVDLDQAGADWLAEQGFDRKE